MDVTFNNLKAPQTITVTKEEFIAKKLFLEKSNLTMQEVDKIFRAKRLLPSPHEITDKKHLNPEAINDGGINLTIIDKNFYTNVGHVYTVIVSTRDGVNDELMLLSTYDDTQSLNVVNCPLHKELLN